MPHPEKNLAERTEPPQLDRDSWANKKVIDVGAYRQWGAHHADRTSSGRARNTLRAIVRAEISHNSDPAKYFSFQRSLPPVQATSVGDPGECEWGRIVVGVAEKDVTA